MYRITPQRKNNNQTDAKSQPRIENRYLPFCIEEPHFPTGQAIRSLLLQRCCLQKKVKCANPNRSGTASHFTYRCFTIIAAAAAICPPANDKTVNPPLPVGIGRKAKVFRKLQLVDRVANRMRINRLNSQQNDRRHTAAQYGNQGFPKENPRENRLSFTSPNGPNYQRIFFRIIKTLHE